MNFAIVGIFSLLSIGCNAIVELPENEFAGMYDVGSHMLYMEGGGVGQPTVILESGIGDGGTMSGWDIVQRKVKKFAQVCLYDRAGLGMSGDGPGPRTTIQIADELHALLQSAKIAPPYILVGHSMGGLHIQTFAMRYPDEVAGMVFVDPTPKELVDSLSAEQLNNLIAAGASQGVMNETGPGMNESILTFKSLPKLPEVPVVVLTSSYTGKGNVAKNQWEELKGYHENMANEVKDGTHIVATKSGHYIQMDEPKLVIEAIESVYNKVK